MRKLLLLITCLLMISYSNAQTWGADTQKSKFKHQLGIGIKASTNGFGGDIYWRPLPKLSVKAGYEQLTYSYDYKFDESKITLDTKFKYKTGALSLTVAYQIIAGIYVTGGAAVFNFKPEVKGVPASHIEIGDITLSPETVGRMDITIKSQNKIAPYAAIGFGNVVPRNKGVSFGVELGTYYMGSPKLDVHATGMLAPTMDPEHVANLQNELKEFKFYPVLKFNLSVKIFTFKN